MVQTNEIIEFFLKHYEQGYYFYDKLATLVADQCEKKVNESSIRAIVTSRAKKIKSLKEKIYQRHKTKNYQSETAIFEDIVDLAGVRIALYFPADRARVENFIKDIFIIVEERPFPRPKTENEEDKTKNKFDGYHADHYRVMLKSETLEDKNKDCVNYIVEIQVASILMHAWSEVNHDLAYKPSSGELSQQELSILDGLNGLVLTGEVLLEQLQSASQERVAHQKEPFANEYELETFVSGRLMKNQSDTSFRMGVEFRFLLDVLYELSQATPDYVDSLLKNINKDIYSITVSHQIFMIIFEKNINHFSIYYDLITDNEYEIRILNHDFTKESIKKILKQLIYFNRYIRYLVFLYDFEYSLLIQQIYELGQMFHVYFDVFYFDEFITKIYDCVFQDLGRKKYNISEIDKEITEILNCFEHIGHPASRKAMEWARSGKSELPEK